MNNFIFSIKEIFTTCLNENNVNGYFIGPYQRGYKWKSKTIHDQVPVLLCDLYDAFLKKNIKQGNTEYYLQYITVKRSLENDSFVFEVIDGQQRLTSLTLIFNVLEMFFEKHNLAKKNGHYLLNYSRYYGAQRNIFDEIYTLVIDEETEIENIKEQDKFYLYHAFKTIHSFFNQLNAHHPDDFNEFLLFIENDVKIILNKEDEFTTAEEVFSSLNANKVPLTNAYLVKGLLLTKASRNASFEGQKKHFKEIMDARSLMAKTWDEMHYWFSRPEVSKYFFNNKDAGMDKALVLVEHKPKDEEHDIVQIFKNSLEQNSNKFDNQYELFNQFHENIITSSDAVEYLDKIKHLYKRLRNWYEDNNWYNLIGYYLKTGGKISELIKEDSTLLKKTLSSHLIKQITYTIKENKKMVKKDIDILGYENNPGKKINKILLSFSVFPEGIDRSKENLYRFDFYDYANEGWSLEHIFPQNPDLDEIDYSDDQDWIIEQCKRNNRKDLIEKIENNEPVNGQELSFIYDSFPDVHILGNMALLSSSVNSALSNGLFNTKRRILIRKINKGSFVPKHTIDVFSKMMEAKKDENKEFVKFEQDIKIWSEKDAAAHLTWMKDRINNLEKEFAI